MTDGLKDMPEAQAEMPPATTLQTCIVHLIRNSLEMPSPPGKTTGPWRQAWDKVIPLFAIPPEVRRVIDTINAIKSVNARQRRIIKTHRHVG